jgi:hypothetical protein
MTQKGKQRPGDYLTLRLFEPERELLQNLGRVRPGVKDRYTALLELVGIVDELELEDVRRRKRQPLRIKIPEALRQVIDRKVEATGQTFIAVLIEAAREYERRHTSQRRRNR